MRIRRGGRKQALVPAFFVLLIFAVPFTIEAGFFSFFAGIFSTEITAYNKEVTTFNSQNVPLLMAARNIDPNPAKGGGDIIVIGGSALLPSAGPLGALINSEGELATSDQISIYVVRADDSLSQIAEMFNVSVNTIIWANDIKRGDLIQPGETLIILPITGLQYTVKKGDTVKSLAKKYDGDADEIILYNGLPEDGTLSVGDVITIPGGAIPAPKIRYVARSVRGANGPTYSGYYLRPVNGARSQGLHGYNAIDLASYAGTPIVAAASGQVIISRSSGWNGGYGKYVVIKHANGTQTLYAHNKSNIVYQGQSVVQGQVIGYVGNTGRSTGAHVHFEVRGARNPF